MDRRTTLKWMLVASASMPFANPRSHSPAPVDSHEAAVGYGTDPDLVRIYRPGDLWPLSFTPEQSRAARSLCDVILPADEHSPSASAVGVVEFLDEWVSAPYPQQIEDRALILEGLSWMDAEAVRRAAKKFVDLDAMRQQEICDDICHVDSAQPAFATAARFFARYRDLTAGGFYSTPVGAKDLGYVGNVPQLEFVGAAPESLRRLGLVEGGARDVEVHQ